MKKGASTMKDMKTIYKINLYSHPNLDTSTKFEKTIYITENINEVRKIIDLTINEKLDQLINEKCKNLDIDPSSVRSLMPIEFYGMILADVSDAAESGNRYLPLYSIKCEVACHTFVDEVSHYYRYHYNYRGFTIDIVEDMGEVCVGKIAIYDEDYKKFEARLEGSDFYKALQIVDEFLSC